MKNVFGAFMLCALLYAGTSSAQTSPSDLSQISTTGRGEVRVKPTRATIYLAVQTRGTTASVAAADNSRIVADVMKGLASAGVRADDMSNSSYSVAPDYEFTNGGRKQIGFIATNGIRIEVSKLENIGKIIDAGLNGGATQVSSVQYSGDKIEEVRRQALKIAVEEATRDAETMAAAAGGRIGRLLSLVASGATPGIALRTTEAGEIAGGIAAASTIVRPTELVVAASASGRWEFIPRQ